jgi:hypothetical protein
MTTAERAPALAPTSNPFAVSQADWVTIQVYVENALHLPVTDEAMATMLKTDVATAQADYSALTSIYAGMAGHSATWKNHTFPLTVNLASDLVHYATKAGTFYGALKQYIPGVIKGDPDAKSAWVEIINSLLQSATTMGSDASKTNQLVTAFSDATDADAATLAQESDRLNTTYNLKQELADLVKRISDLQQMLADMQKEYDEDVIIAATSATYAWIFPFGTIASAVVAGKYGSDAAAVKRAMDAAKGELDQAKGQYATDSALVAMLSLADTSTTQIQGSLKNAQPVIEKVKGIWAALAQDLTYLRDIVNQDIAKAAPVIASLGVDEAIAQWQKIGAEADSYRVNAFVTISVDTGSGAPASNGHR